MPAVMHRMRADRSLEVIPVDIDGIMEGRVADIALQKNDILFVPTRQELMQEQTLTLHGEVHYPGIYRYAANMTIEDLILQAGGRCRQTSPGLRWSRSVPRRASSPAPTVWHCATGSSSTDRPDSTSCPTTKSMYVAVLATPPHRT